MNTEATSLCFKICKEKRKLWEFTISLPARYEKWSNASMKGIDSMSPIVPPSSMTQTSAGSSVPSTVVFHL